MASAAAPRHGGKEDPATVAAVRAGDAAAFSGISERYRRELQVHCYRMLGSFEESEDLVQETLLRAWQRRHTFEGRSTVRAWLYRIATNACLDALNLRNRRARLAPGPAGAATSVVPWLQPYPDHLLEPATPDAVVAARETIELAFMAAIQHLPPRQRAVLVFRDVLGWPASDTSALLDMSVAAVKSALQRARHTLRTSLPDRRTEWSRPDETARNDDRFLLRRFVEATERYDIAALTRMLRDDAVQTMPPYPERFEGRDAIIAMWSSAMVGPDAGGDWRAVATGANLQPAVANYFRAQGGDVFTASNLDVLRVEDGLIAEIVTFEARLFAAFGLPLTL
jgi:RNA polymerase sigma-70 factor (ECF subfamily)